MTAPGPGRGPRFVPGGLLIPAPFARRLLAWLLPLLRDAARTSGHTLHLPGDVAGFLSALNAVDVSGTGPTGQAPATVVTMSSSVDAATAVGLSDRHVRRLCARGLVTHQRTSGGRYLVNIDSLQAHLRHGEGGAAA